LINEKQHNIQETTLPRAIRRTLITRMIVGLIGMTPDFISSRMIPAIERKTMAMSSWFHLEKNSEQRLRTTVN